MARRNTRDRIDRLLQSEQWSEARRLLERAKEEDPGNHWLITQIGVTLYEQRRYADALKLFQASLKIVPDCPLTLWNLAGTLDSLGKHKSALSIFAGLLQSEKTAEEDTCWESKEWTDALKTDCVYRMGDCFRHMGKKQNAQLCYRQYLVLLSLGFAGSYAIDDVRERLRAVNPASGANQADSEFRKTVNFVLRKSGIDSRNGRKSAKGVLDLINA